MWSKKYKCKADSSKGLLLLLHPFPAGSIVFRKMIPVLSQDFDCLVVDIPGFGNSSNESYEEFDIDLLVEDIRDVVVKENSKKQKVYIFGMSFGGVIAKKYNQKYAVERIVIDSMPWATKNITVPKEFFAIRILRGLFFTKSLKSLLASILKSSRFVINSLLKIYRKITTEIDEEIDDDLMITIAQSINYDVFFKVFRYIENYDVTELSGKDSSKFLYLSDVTDPAVSYKYAKKYIGDAKSITVNKGMHPVCLTSFVELSPQIIDFLLDN
jgi:pimeloyl-ACP methyl ester carboxylesterase